LIESSFSSGMMAMAIPPGRERTDVPSGIELAKARLSDTPAGRE
jgi:hypothetical protein